MARGSLFECAGSVRAVAPNLTDDEIEEVLSAIVRRERGMANRRGDALRWVEIAKERSAEEIKRAMIEARARRMDALKRQRLDADVERNLRLAGKGGPVRAVSDLITTTERHGEGRAMSAQSRIRAAQQEIEGAFLADVQQIDGGMALLRNLHRMPEEERALAREIARLSGGDAAPATDARIKAVAEAMFRHRERLRAALNAEGAWIDPYRGYVTRTTHSSRRIQTAGVERWLADVLPRLDLERTLGDATLPDAKGIEVPVDVTDQAQVSAWLRRIYSNLVSGIHDYARPGDAGDPLVAFKGPGNLARKLSEDRVLHWRDADAWLDYERLYGSQSLVAAYFGQIEHGARALGLMRQFGTNPEASLSTVVDRLGKQLAAEGREADAGALKAAWAGGFGAPLRNQWSVVSGESSIAVHQSLATYGAAWRALQNLKLGGAAISSITDLPAMAATLRHEGVPFLQAITGAVRGMFDRMPSEIRQEVAANVLAGMNHFKGGLYHRMGYGEAVPGFAGRMLDKWFKLNLLTPWTDGVEFGTAAILSTHIGRNLSRGWEAINPDLRAGLARFGVTADDWARMQATRALVDEDGTRHFHPGLLRELGDGAAAERVGAWFANLIEAASSRPNEYTRAVLMQGTRPGTVLGEALRMFAQFKQFPMQIITRHLAREAYRAGPQLAWRNVASLAAQMTVFGYVAMTMKELAAGKLPRRIETIDDAQKAFYASLVQGGGFGLLGDFAFGNVNRIGGSPWSTALGPTAGTLEQAIKTWSRMLAGDDPTAQGVRFVAREMLPFTSLFYARLAFDHLFIYHLQEMANPGYLRRVERQVERDANQEWWLPPTAALR